MAELLTDQLRTMARLHGNEVAYTNLDAGTAITFARWEQDSNRLARGLIAAGVAKGDRVSIYLPGEEVLRWIVAYSAVHKAGAVVVPTNTRLTAVELSTILAHAGARAAVTDRSLLPALAAAAPGIPTLSLVVTTDAADRTAEPGAASVAEAGPLAGSLLGWGSALDHDAGEIQVNVGDDDLADIMYTSGTTGSPKGVVVRHRNVSLLPNGEPPWSGSSWIHGSPLFTFAGIAFVYNPMKLGMAALFLPRFDAGRWLRLVARERPAAAFIVPAMAQLILGHPDFETADLASLSLCALGSAPVAPGTLRRLQARMPQATVSNGYGMTEAGPAYCAMPREEAQRRVGSVGKPMPPMEVRIAGEAGDHLGTGEVGEVLIRMPGRQREYYRDPDATAETWSDGWLHTGDLGKLDEDGYLYIVGRKKEVIIRGGNNVYATDVEAVLLEHPSVLEAAVIGVPHDVLGEDVAAFVVLRAEGATTPEDLRAFCAQRLADYKVPRRIRLLDGLPRNATGKVMKHQLALG
jgi:acyl-CoA synthetase (AMP-forming)/AMP-acid ligase II